MMILEISPMGTKSLEERFNAAMLDIYNRAKAECNYNATRFRHMLFDHGGLETAKRLINSSEPSEGFTKLWESKRLDLTVEAHVLLPEFQSLFTDEELKRARSRLQDYGYQTPEINHG